MNKDYKYFRAIFMWRNEGKCTYILGSPIWIQQDKG